MVPGMATSEPTPAEPPACERCGTRTYPSTRWMRDHDISTGRAIPRDRLVPTWRCPACNRETPRDE
jgi:hypothetical protein